MESKIKFAVVGCGHIGKRHAAMIMNNEECELVALCDTAPREKLNIGEWAVPFYNSLEELSGSGISPDVMCIATPNGMHEEQAIMAINAGCHVVIEKPMALSAKGCERILDAAVAKEKQVFCVMQNRFSAPAKWLKDIIEQKILGDIYIVQVNCYWNRDERYYNGKTWHGTKKMDGGTLFTQFSHFVDTLYWLFGDIKNINSRLNNFNHKGITDFEDSGFVNFDFVNGGTCSFNYSTSLWDKNFESSITVIAKNGTTRIGGQYLNELQYCDIKDHDGVLFDEISMNKHYLIIKNVVDVLKGREALLIDPSDGLKVVEIIERIYAAAP